VKLANFADDKELIDLKFGWVVCCFGNLQEPYHYDSLWRVKIASEKVPQGFVF
jgi:hypothetical protein